jgi:hypothetical protein
LPDSVPSITRAHFEASMTKARHSVGPEIIQQYNKFTAKIKQQWITTGAESGDSTAYDMDSAAAEQAQEDVMLDGVEEEEPVEEDEPVKEDKLVPATGGDESFFVGEKQP